MPLDVLLGDAVEGRRGGSRNPPLGLVLQPDPSRHLLPVWNKALDSVETPDLVLRAQERADLDCWISRVRRVLEIWSPCTRDTRRTR